MGRFYKAEDITHYSDGGGKAIAALKPLHGCHKVGRFLLAIRRSKILPNLTPHLTTINGQPGIVNYFEDRKPQSAVSFNFSQGQIKSCFAVVNPDKLTIPN